MREEHIINGQISLKWILKKQNEHGTWDDVDYAYYKETINVLNDEYDKMSYTENFK